MSDTTDHETKTGRAVTFKSVLFGLLGIFTYGYVFVPLAIVTSFIALLMGQFIWFALGMMLAVVGFATSPSLWLLVGLGALAAWLRQIGIPIPDMDDMGSALLESGFLQWVAFS